MAGVKDTKEWKEEHKNVKQDIKNINNSYDKGIDTVKNYEKEQTKAINNWEKSQTNLQNQSFALQKDEINQQKEWTKQDYQKEQSGAYVDWQKQSNRYGANAEKMAQSGLSGSGYSESSQVSMYNAYQNRVATARESFNRAIQEYDNMMNQAYLQNSAALAEIAFNALQSRLQINLQSFEKILNLQQGKRQELSNRRNEWKQWQQSQKAIYESKKDKGSTATSGKRVSGGKKAETQKSAKIK